MYLSFWLPLKLLSTCVGILLGILEHGVAQTCQMSMKGDSSGTNLLKDKQKQKENIGLLLNRRGELVTNNAEEAEVLNPFFTSVFTSIVGPQALGTKIQVDANRPTVREGRVVMWTIIGAQALTISTQGC